jgi:translation initiation factor 1 (eIF-1/SUI1)
MEVTAALRRQFGMVARFRENVLEVEGDQRSRLGAWLAAQGYAVPDADREG